MVLLTIAANRYMDIFTPKPERISIGSPFTIIPISENIPDCIHALAMAVIKDKWTCICQ